MSTELLIDTLKVYENNQRNERQSARSLNISRTTFQYRLAEAQAKFPEGPKEIPEKWTYPRMISLELPKTTWIVGSDLHVWTGEPTLIFKAFCAVAKKLKVDGIVLNGDIIDGARISRHPSVRGSKAPKIEHEIETAKKWLKNLPFTKHRLWTMGNHDLRLDNYVASNASEMDGYIMSLSDHFRDWTFSFAFDLNGTEIRHRFRSGIHGGWNNTLHSGVNIMTGHTHQLQVTAMRDRNGTRWGIETGMLADPFGPQFEYSEGSPSRSQMGFVVVSFDEDGRMMPPETCEMVGGRPVFRGQNVF
jgi:hypothetical protein